MAELIYDLPPCADYGIGIVGPGGIVNGAHMPAYRMAGLKVVNMYGRSEHSTAGTAARWDIPRFGLDYDRFLADPEVRIVDIATMDEGRVELVRKAAEAGKHILIQKPFAHRIEDAEAMVAAAERFGVKLAVNQNARFAPFYRMAKRILDSGVLGVPYLITHEMRINQDRSMAGTHFASMPHFLLADYDGHHFDLMRYWAGRMPERVYCSTTRMQGQHFSADMTALTLLEFADGLRCTVTSVDSAQGDEELYRFAIEGSKGSLYGQMKAGYKYPSIRYKTVDEPERWIEPELRGDWFPDAFYGTMFELMHAIGENREPEISGRDNLDSLRLQAAVIRSAETGRIVRLDEAAER